jgi:hypothetical protein
MANGGGNGLSKAALQDCLDQATEILTAAYTPEASREELAAAVGEARATKTTTIKVDMRIASQCVVSDSGIETDPSTKRFTFEEFQRVMRCNSFVGSVSFWRALEGVADPEPRVRLHAMGVLGELARRSYAECRGVALSPQHYEALRFCGFEPMRVAAPGELASEPVE